MEDVDDKDSDDKKTKCSYIIPKRSSNRTKWKFIMIILLMISIF
jgi:hypothetical protein